MHWLFWICVAFVGVVRSKDYCERETIVMSCPREHVIILKSVKYGRMRISKCIKKDYGSLGCFTESSGLLGITCSGRNSCRLPVSRLQNLRCPADLLNYASVRYSCSRTTTCDPMTCSDTPISSSFGHAPSEHETTALEDRKTPLHQVGFVNDAPLPNHAPSDNNGYLWRRPTAPCGSRKCPWRVRVSPEQEVKFGVFNHVYSTKGTQLCQKVAVVHNSRDDVIDQLTACAGDGKMTTVTFRGPAIYTLTFEPKSSGKLVHFQVLGCATPTNTKAATFTRTSNLTLTLKCGDLSRRHFVCNRTSGHWMGDAKSLDDFACKHPEIQKSGNNSDPIPPLPWLHNFRKTLRIPNGIAFVIGIGVFLGIIFGGVLLVITACIEKKKYGHCEASTSVSVSQSRDEIEQSFGESRQLAIPPASGGYVDQCTMIRASRILPRHFEPSADSHIYEDPPYCQR